MTIQTRAFIAGLLTLVVTSGVSSMQQARVRQASGPFVAPLAHTSEAFMEPVPDATHHMFVPSRARGAGLVASGQMQHLMDSMRALIPFAPATVSREE